MVDSSEPINKGLTRREFLKKGAELALGTGSIILFGRCMGSRPPKEKPQDVIQTTPKLIVPTPEISQTLPEITTQEINEIAKEAINDYNKVLNLNLSSEELLTNTIILSDLNQYQNTIAANEVDYQPSNELDRPAITTEPSSPSGHKIYLYTPSLNNMTNLLPNNELGKQARKDFIESIFTHEIGHWLSKEYKSDELHNIVYGKMLANILRGHSVTQDIVLGAQIKAVVDGKKKSPFDILEEAEASLIGDYIMNNRGKPQIGSYITGKDIGVDQNENLLSRLLTDTFQDPKEGIKSLLSYRREAGGREQLAKKIGNHYGILEPDQLFFGMSVLWTINTNDQKAFNSLITRQ